MPGHFFDTDDGERRFRDGLGLELPDIETVAAEAFGLLHDRLLHDLAHGRMPEGRCIMTAGVRNDAGVLVYRGEMTVDGDRLRP